MRGRWALLALLVVGAIFLYTNLLGGRQARPEITIGMPPWTTSPPPTYIAKVLLEDYMDVDVNIQEADVGVVYQGLANQDIDLLADGWMPNFHANYFEAHGDKLDQLGSLYRGAELGWAVPAYVPVHSVEELNDYVEEFNGQVIGIDPGAGMMRVSQDVIDTYGLNYELVEGSEFTMLSALRDAIQEEDWIVFLAWRPHFKFAQYDLRILEEPRGLWTRDNVIVVARRGFREQFPEAARLLARWELPIEELEEMINEIEVENRDPEQVAREWVQARDDQVREWIRE